MTAALHRLGRACARHRWIVIAAWVAAAALLTVAAQRAGERTSDDLTLPGTGSTQAADALARTLPAQANGSNPVVVATRHGTLASDGDALDQTVAALRGTPHVSGVGQPVQSRDGTIAEIPVTLDLAPGALTKAQARAVLDAAQPARAAGLRVAIGGYAGAALSKPSTHASEAVGLAAAVIVLLLAFGSAAAMALPLISALLGLAGTLGIVTLLGHLVDVPTVAPTLATMIGLGVGIDYALFIVTRHRRQLREGAALGESIARATAAAGGAVLFAGGTVVIALCSLAVAGIPLVTALGCVSAVAVVVSVLAALTLLPALLGVLGPRVDSGRGRHGRSDGWARWARGVAERPWRSALAGTAVLVVLALPVLHLHLGQSDVGALPSSTTARQAYDLMSRGFGPGSNGPLLVAADVSGKDDPALDRLAGDLRATPGVRSVSAPVLDAQGTTAVLTVVPTTAPSDRRTEQLVTTLRDDVIPQAHVTAFVGGQTAGYIDLASRISATLPAMIAIVVGLSFVLLLLAFRSLLLPAKAAVMNLLSVGAAYGVVTLVFQDGHGASLVGLAGPIPVVSFVPLLMFAILFGLSMDYEVFLLTEIQDHYRREQRPVRAVVDGLAGTGRVITSAALIMVCVFSSFVLNGDPVVKQFGIGLAVAIAVDATVVRCLLVPAVMALAGRASWWLPPGLDRVLPRIAVEGEASAG